MAGSAGRAIGIGYVLILVALVFASIAAQWPDRPDVLAECSLHATSQSFPLYVGSAPGRRVEFRIDFYVGTLYNLFKSVASDDEPTPVAGSSEFPGDAHVENRTLSHRTGRAILPFAPASGNVLSARALSHQFGQIAFCHGYVFLGKHIPRACARNRELATLQCAGGIETCLFEASVQTSGGLHTRHTVVFSATNEQTIIPHSFS